MPQFVNDLRYEIRTALRRPGWVVAAVLLLGVGIGSNTAIFAAVQHLVLRPLPYDDASRMVFVWQTAERGGSSVMISPRPSLIAALRERATVLEWIEAWQGFSATLLEGAPALIDAARVSPALFGRLGVAPLLGRGFVADDGNETTGPVAVLSYGAWQTWFGGDPGVVGREIRLAEGPRTVVGVMPADFLFLRPSEDTDLWVPVPQQVEALRSGPAHAIALLRAGVHLEGAQAELHTLAEGLHEVDAGLVGWTPTLVRPVAMFGDELRTAVLVLQGAVALVLLIACGNVANLLLARGVRRRRELTIRAALGAGRGRLLCHLTVQGLLVGLAGAGLGLLLASWGIDLIRGLRPDNLASLDALALDPVVFGFTVALGVVTGAGVGFVPALRATRVQLADSLRQAGSASGDTRHRWLRGTLVSAQVAFCLVLLMGAGLLIRSFAHLINRDPGFDPRGLLAVTVEPPRERYPTMADEVAFFDRLAERLRQDPRIEGATVAGGLPPETGILFGTIQVEGQSEPIGDGTDVRALVRADPEYFRVLRVRIVEGRAFDAADRASGEQVVIINERLAREHLPNGAVGRRLRLGGDTWYRVVGVAADVRQLGLKSLSHQLYFPVRQSGGFGASSVVLRTEGDPLVLVGAVRAAVRAIDPALPIRSLSTAEDLLAGSVARERFLAALLTILAAAALILALVGVYGMVSHGVEERVREIGIRRAVGAGRADVIRFVLARGVWPVAVGLGLGIVGAFAGARTLRSLLHGVGPNDPASLLLATGLLGAAAVLAHLLPAARAVRLDPMTVLREE